jgi:hypothetical protein
LRRTLSEQEEQLIQPEYAGHKANNKVNCNEQGVSAGVEDLRGNEYPPCNGPDSPIGVQALNGRAAFVTLVAACAVASQIAFHPDQTRSALQTGRHRGLGVADSVTLWAWQ